MKKTLFSNFLVIMTISAMSGVVLPFSAMANETGTAASVKKVSTETSTIATSNVKAVAPKAADKVKEADEKRAEAKQQKAVESRKSAFNKVVDALIKQGENLKNRVLKGKENYGDLKNTVIAGIDAIVAKISALKQRVAAATAEDVKTLIQEAKTYREEIKQFAQHLTVLSQIGQFEFSIIKKAEDKANRIAEKIAEFKEAGKDVVKLESLLSDVRSKIVDARAKLNQLRTDVGVKVGEIKTFEIRAALNKIKDVIKDVNQLFRQISQVGAGLKPVKSEHATSTSAVTVETSTQATSSAQ